MRRLAALCPEETIGAEVIAAELAEAAAVDGSSRADASRGPEPLSRGGGTAYQGNSWPPMRTASRRPTSMTG